MRLVNAYTEAADLVDWWLKKRPLHWGRPLTAEAASAFDRVTKNLRALGPNPCPDDVDNAFSEEDLPAIYVEHVRRKFLCNDCGRKDCSEVLEIGEQLTSDSMPAMVCAECLVKALKLIDG